jgi:large subunit ribosomal protein L6
MSRIGKQPIKVPAGVKVSVQGQAFSFEGPKGKIAHTIPRGVVAVFKDNVITVSRDEAVEKSAALWGLNRTLLANCVQGVAQGFSKTLEINGVGYRAQVQGQEIQFTLGFSHQIKFALPKGVTAAVDKNTVVTLTGADKELVGRLCAQIKALRPVEPYQGKGIRYQGEHVIRKAGKAAGAAKSA